MVRVAIAGASGYTGFELVRLLCAHPSVRITMITSRQHKGRRLDDIYPALKRHCDLVFEGPDPEKLASSSDLVFTALPHEAAMDIIPGLLDLGGKVIDLSADYRLRDAAVYGKWYSTHKTPELLKSAVYGLPELYREQIRNGAAGRKSRMLSDERHSRRGPTAFGRADRFREHHCRLQVRGLGRGTRSFARRAFL